MQDDICIFHDRSRQIYPRAILHLHTFSTTKAMHLVAKMRASKRLRAEEWHEAAFDMVTGDDQMCRKCCGSSSSRIRASSCNKEYPCSDSARSAPINSAESRNACAPAGTVILWHCCFLDQTNETNRHRGGDFFGVAVGTTDAAQSMCCAHLGDLMSWTPQ